MPYEDIRLYFLFGMRGNIISYFTLMTIFNGLVRKVFKKWRESIEDGRGSTRCVDELMVQTLGLALAGGGKH